MTQRNKSKVFDFIMTLGTLEFMYYVFMIEFFDYKPRRLKEKVYSFNRNLRYKGFRDEIH